MECEKASRRLRNLLRHAEKNGVSERDLGRLPAVSRLLARGQGRHRLLLAVWPLTAGLLLFLFYCYCNQATTTHKQPMAGHYDDMTNLAT